MKFEKPVRQVLIDCSSTRTCEFNSGIQRVVRSLCQQANEQGDSIAVIPVYGKDDQFFHAQSLWPSHRNLTGWEACLANSKVANFYRKTAKSISKRIPNRKWENLFGPAPTHVGNCNVTKFSSKKLLKKYTLFKPKVPPIDIKKGDVVLLADASWQQPNWGSVQSARSRGALIGNIIYDLIPITHPQFFQYELVQRFSRWFEHTASTSDFFMCISDWVASQMRSQLVRYGRERLETEQTCVSFPLGADLATWNLSDVCPQFQTLFKEERSNNPHLIVGTLEPRKNHAIVIDAFEKLWQAGSQERLCITGRLGWNCESLVNRISNHPEFDRRLFMANSASDADVAFGYEHAKSVITASHTEGFGLPIVESLQFGQKVLASDTPIHREVGKDRVQYFAIDQSCDPLVELIEITSSADAPERHPIHVSRPISWSESYQQIISQLDNICEYLYDGSDSRKAA